MEPLSLIAMGAAVGGAAGKFVEKAWDAGEKWLQSYFANHKEKAQEQAKLNSADFLNHLAERIKILEGSRDVVKLFKKLGKS